MKVTMVGAGYVGLLSGVCLAAKGHEVTCVDVSAALVEQLNNGEPHFYEPGVAELLRSMLGAGRFAATTDLSAALDRCELVIVAVGTPTTEGAIDLSAVIEVARRLGSYLRTHDRSLSVVIKSTVIPGTTDTVVRKEIAAAAGKENFGLGMNPEFLREGNAIADFMEPDRIVLGYEDERTLQLLGELYAPWPVEKIRVNTRTAELIKYANNILLATQISATNEIANLASALGGIDVMEVMQAVHLDKRWNPVVGDRRVEPGILSYLKPGCGFGGSCFPKDLQAIRSLGAARGLPMHLLDAVLAVNESQPMQIIDLLESETPLAGKTVLLLGLAFKPETDDVRESASLKIARLFLEKNARLQVHDPVATKNCRAALGRSADSVAFLTTWQECVGAADVIVVATAWPEYRELTRADLRGKILFDARRMFAPGDFATGKYLSIGRRPGSQERPA